ncbi:MAG: hypothetical protein AUJ92_11810 [Armatimonadetes bacterium CG2_30_59_28]|nr:hypothetical protein [Armatimonadota bacterium]OIO93718.1 MAG: hypothetical protein AUJ92_11810 [Armatimonadetes bacterium CG2_30_59_28]PIU60804.1 MAG: hypothetical protein COS85_22570 [Armatimonadetes bacterium CG07_land_8_20_14_0_80_59_28]PIX44593.1 MAG: hypothetical protein COZ56_04185 [Armatimonadetes bacterium CG_4_8_14_3_um_filter_58_9]PIY44247.1 MAG: hypothetical protein COZ05_08760 [Armatimonadetes bacterium CG_4_10_14_3_um_filter_59_10]PJB68724.1 MAG: hypothetical protein CO095_109
MFPKLPELVGYSPWCLTDIRVPLHWRWCNEGKDAFRYGCMDENWEKKEIVFKTMKQCIARLREAMG